MSEGWLCPRCAENSEVITVKDVRFLRCSRCHLEMGVALDMIELGEDLG